MSYDLHVNTHLDPAGFERITQALVGEPVEVLSASDGRVLVGVAARTKVTVLRRLFSTLVEVARAHGYALHDPQTGTVVDLAAPAPLPPGWAPPLTLAAVRKLTQRGHYLELLRDIHLVADVNACAAGDSVLSLVMMDAWAKGPTCRGADGRLLARAAEDVALKLLELGADPRQHGEDRAPPIYWAVATDSERLVSAILAMLTEPERQALLTRRLANGTLLDIATSTRATRAAAALRQAAVR